MRVIRLWRRYDSFKAAVLLTAAALLISGYCVRSAAAYAEYLRTPTEYVCTAAEGIDKVLPVLSGTEGIRTYSKQKSAYLSDGRQGINVVMLSPAYLADCYELSGDTRAVYMNAAAFSQMFGDAQSPVSFRGTLDGAAYSASVIRTDNLPGNEPAAVTAVSAAELQDADAVRIALSEQGSFSPESAGLTVLNREERLAAGYEQKLFLLRIRFAALSAFLALVGAAAFFRIYRDAADPRKHNRTAAEYDN